MTDRKVTKKRKPDVDPDVHRTTVATPGLMRVGTKEYIYQFDPRVMHTREEGKRLGIFGMSGSGKSRLLLKLLTYHNEIPAWMILNPSEPGNHMYAPHVENEGIIHDEEDTDILVKDLCNFKARQLSRCKDWAIKGSDPVQFWQDPSAGCICDDICEDVKVFNQKIFGWLFANSRNFKTFFVILIQYYYMLPKKYRWQLSHLFIFAMNSQNGVQDIWKECCMVVDKFDDFKRIFSLATAVKGRCLVIDNTVTTSDFTKKIFWFQHDFQRPKFKLGAPYWNADLAKRFNKKWDDPSARKTDQSVVKASKNEPKTLELAGTRESTFSTQVRQSQF